MKIKTNLLAFFIVVAVSGCTNQSIKRTVISLNGMWDITLTDTLSVLPDQYSARVRVPGLVDMANPRLEPIDRIFNDTTAVVKNSSIYFNNSKYWYRRTFSVPSHKGGIVNLKINKAQYHTWVYVNGQLAGENVYSFTPTLIDIKPFLKKSGKDNELVIAVGSRNNLPDTVINGCDYEKVLFIPGIYDDVTLILSGKPNIINVQTVPEISENRLRVIAEIGVKEGKPVRLSYSISESVSGKVVAKGKIGQLSLKDDDKVTSDFRIDMPEARLWTPENPFLYRLELSTGSDTYETIFGMRKFEVCSDSSVVMLNGRPYYMRGTNVCINRYFEDSSRADLPWNRNWVIKLHQAFKYMHGNSIRYCIGFPPELWYEVADSLGFLIQDEYPVWGFNMPGKPSRINSDQLANEYREWMRERWNHPSVVIWDAQNETRSDTVTRAIMKARAADVSERPWDNGWTAPATEKDVSEAHPYQFWKYYDRLSKSKLNSKSDGFKILGDILSKPMKPTGGPPNNGKGGFSNPVIINEYAWAWINRDGSPTLLTDNVFKYMFPEADTPEKRLETYAKVLGMKTEYWRSQRNAAGVLEFCGLGYSRAFPPRGQTSDHLKDAGNVILDSSFVRYVRPAFSPVGIMLDYWETSPKAGSETDFRINIINDNYENWAGSVKFRINDSKGREFKTLKVGCDIPPLGKRTITISKIKLPVNAGHYKIIAELIYGNEPVMSIREIEIQ